MSKCDTNTEKTAVGKAQRKLAQMFCKSSYCLEFLAQKQVEIDGHEWFLFTFLMHAPDWVQGHRSIQIYVPGATDGKKVVLTEQDHAMLKHYDEQSAIRDVKNQLDQDFFVNL